MADMTVLPVRIIMSPTCSSRFLVGKNALSATALTNYSPSVRIEEYATSVSEHNRQTLFPR
jgi:hypothetical protein